MDETRQRVFVTGASGYVGRHIVRQLCERGHRVRALVRQSPQRAFHPSVELVIGDLSRPETYARKLDGMSAVVHAALTENLAAEPQATSTLLSLSAHAGVRKFVHLSSIVIYGNPPEGIIAEETTPRPSSDSYSSTKLKIEEALQAAAPGLELAILRLGCVYGPGGGWWTEGLLNQMQRGKLILVNSGTGIANLIHVSDAALMVALLLRRSGAPLEIFNVTDGMPVEWSRYYAKLEELAGKSATVSMTAAEAREHGRKWHRPSFARRLLRKVTGAPVIYPIDERGVDNMASRAVYSNEKAATVLHFVPEYDLESGMRSVHAEPSGIPASLLATP